MAIHSTDEGLCREAAQEFLDAAEVLLNTNKKNGGVMGYPAALLLLTLVDTIGHHLKVGHGPCRFDVLKEPCFGLTLTSTEIGKITKWYRHPLAHNAAVVAGVLLTTESSGLPFDFTAVPPVMRLGALHAAVKSALTQVLSAPNFDPLASTRKNIGQGTNAPASPTVPSNFTYTPAASGVF